MSSECKRRLCESFQSYRRSQLAVVLLWKALLSSKEVQKVTAPLESYVKLVHLLPLPSGFGVSKYSTVVHWSTSILQLKSANIIYFLEKPWFGKGKLLNIEIYCPPVTHTLNSSPSACPLAVSKACCTSSVLATP
jgi:hypothetical protein